MSVFMYIDIEMRSHELVQVQYHGFRQLPLSISERQMEQSRPIEQLNTEGR